MEEKNRSMTDEALSQQLRRHKSGKLTGRLLSLVGVVIAVAGMVLGGNIVPVILGGVILALGQTIQRKTREQAGQQTFRTGVLCHQHAGDCGAADSLFSGL